MRVSRLLEQVRRTETALHALGKVLDKRGPELWAAVEREDAAGEDGRIVALLRAAMALDELGDTLAAWADDRNGSRPDDAVDAVTGDVCERLDDLGLPREEPMARPPRRRG